MALKLRVISDHYQQLGKQSSRLFGVTGGRIGRSADNDWILPDPDRYISSHHAEVRFESGRWLLDDVSTNGTYINDSEVPLSQKGPCQLHDGDRLRMGDYDILVSIDDRNDFPPETTGQIPTPPSPRSKAKAARRDDDELNIEIDIHDLLTTSAPQPEITNLDPVSVGNAYGMSAGLREVPASRANGPAKAPQTVDEFRLNDGPLLSGAAGVDWHLKTRRINPEKKPAAAPEPHADLQASLEAFCKGAGIELSSLPTDTHATMLTLAGQILREVVLGLLEASKSRIDVKPRAEAGVIPMQGVDNNPLKLATSVEDGLRRLLDVQNTRQMGPVESIRDSFGDLRNHQQALITAMHAALNGTLSRIDPNELQARFDRSLNRGGLMSAANKLKYWDMYMEFFQVLNQRNSDGLPLSFAEDFTQAYGDRLAGFKNPRRR